jgi:hypothetical protein
VIAAAAAAAERSGTAVAGDRAVLALRQKQSQAMFHMVTEYMAQAKQIQ